MIFAIVFGILTDKIENINILAEEIVNQDINQAYFDTLSTHPPPAPEKYRDIVLKCLHSCHYENRLDWTRKHMMDSWEEFWGASLVCFILGAYAIAGSIYVYNNEPSNLPEDEKPIQNDAPVQNSQEA